LFYKIDKNNFQVTVVLNQTIENEITFKITYTEQSLFTIIHMFVEMSIFVPAWFLMNIYIYMNILSHQAEYDTLE